MGPPIVPENWCSLSGMSTGLMAVRVEGVTQLWTDGGQNPSVENDFAWKLPPGRPRYSASPWKLLVQDLVTMLRAGPEVQPNSEANAFCRTWISLMAPRGTVAIAVWRPHPSSLFAPSRVNDVARREPTPVMKYVALTKRSPVPFPCRNAELSKGRLVDLRPRIGVSAICGLSSGRPICGFARTPSVVP